LRSAVNSNGGASGNTESVIPVILHTNGSETRASELDSAVSST